MKTILILLLLFSYSCNKMSLDVLQPKTSTIGLMVQKSSSALVVNEGSSVVIVVALTGIRSEDTRIAVNLSDPGQDASNISSSFPLQFTIPAGESTGTVTISTLNNPIYTGNKPLELEIVSEDVPGEVELAILIKDLQSRPSLKFSTVGQNLNEASGVGTVNVSLAPASYETIEVDYDFSDGTASGGDYTGIGGTLTFAPGETSKTINFSITEDVNYETTEAFTILLKDASGDVSIDETASAHLVNIVDNEVSTFALSNISLSEGSLATFTVTLSPAAADPVSVNYASANGSALSGTHYTGGSGTLTFSPGETSKTVSLPTSTNAAVCEPDRTFNLGLSSPTGNSNIGVTSATATIVDPSVPALTVASGSGTEGAGVTFTASLSEACSTKNVSFNYATSSGTAVSGTDFAATNTTATILAGATSTSLSIPTIQDTVYEGSETFNLTMSAGTNVTFSNTTATGTISDDEGIPTVGFSTSSQTKGEASGAGSVTISLSGTASTNVVANYSFSNGSAANGSDYTGTDGSVTFAPGETSKTVAFSITEDAVYEVTENFIISLDSVTGGGTLDSGAAAHTVSITDNEISTIAVSNVSVNEGDQATFTVTLTPASAGSVSVDYATADGTATAPGHYASGSGTITFAAGETSKTVSFNTVNNTALACEPNRNFTLGLSNQTGSASIGTATGTATITDPVVPVISVANGTATEGAAVAFVATLSAPCSSSNVTFDYATSAGTASSGTDFSGASGTATIIAGNSSVTVNVNSIDDSIYEGSETFSLGLTNPVNATLASSSATGTINDDEGIPTVSFSTSSQSRSESVGTATVSVTLSHASTQAVTVPFTLSGTATPGAGNDYTVPGSSISVPALSTSGSITVTVNDDVVTESNETAIFTMGTPTNATAAAPTTHTLTITDNETVALITNVTSNNTNNSYGVLSNVDVRVQFDMAVTVSGSPRLLLNTTPARYATYLSGTGSTTIVFRYTVAAGDSSSDLDYASTNALELNGGSISGAGQDANLTLATPGASKSLGFNKNIVIDTDGPTDPSSIILGAVPQMSWRTPDISWTNSTDGGGSVTYEASVYKASDNSLLKSWSSITNGGFENSLVLNDGEDYYVKLRAKDNAGNLSGEVQSPNWTASVLSSVSYAGFMWHAGNDDTQSCDDICGSHGGVHPATRSFAGSHGEGTGCGSVVEAMGRISNVSGNVEHGNSTGCVFKTTVYRGLSKTLSTGTRSGGYKRVCACNNGSAIQGNPNDVIGLTVKTSSLDSITLAWKTFGTTNYDFVIAYSVGATAPADCSSPQITSVNSPVDERGNLSHTIQGLTQGTEYSFRLCSVNDSVSTLVSSGAVVTGETETFDADAASRAPVLVSTSFTNSSASGAFQEYSHTVPPGNDRILIVNVSTINTKKPTSVSFNGINLTKILEANQGAQVLEHWYLLNPPVTTANVRINFPSSTLWGASGAMSFNNVDQLSPYKISTTSNGSSIQEGLFTSAQDEYVLFQGTENLFELGSSFLELYRVDYGTYNASTAYGSAGMRDVFYKVSLSTNNTFSALSLMPSTGPKINNARKGFFIMSNSQPNGNLGGLGGADSLCLNELTTNDWLGKSEAVDKGILDAAHVKAFLCDSTVCNNLKPFVNYYFARAGSASTGGASFTTSVLGEGPGNWMEWDSTTYFGIQAEYWSNRNAGISSHWGYTPGYTDNVSTCTGFTSALSSQIGIVGESHWASDDSDRWNYRSRSCNSIKRLICLVNPD